MSGYRLSSGGLVNRARTLSFSFDGKTYTAHVIGTDPMTDVALIKLEGAANLPAAKLGNADFMTRAPEEVVEEQRERRRDRIERQHAPRRGGSPPRACRTPPSFMPAATAPATTG